MKNRTALCAGVMAGLVLAGVAHADSVTLTPSKDNTLYENVSGVVSNGAGPSLFAGVINRGGIRRAVMRFDVSSIPPGSTVTSARLTVNVLQSIIGGVEFGVHRLERDWGEGASIAPLPGGQGTTPAAGDATWIHTFFPGSLWTTPGGDFAAAASGTATLSAGPGTFGSTPGMVSDVQSWVNAPATNFGWVLKASVETGTSAKRLGSREAVEGQRPLLVVEFTPPACPGQGPGACGRGDWNEDGVVDFNDLLGFLNDYNASTPCSDVNEDGVTDFNDLLGFLNFYNAGC